MSSSESDDIAVPISFWGQRSPISTMKSGLGRSQNTNERRLKIENKSFSPQNDSPSFQKATSSSSGGGIHAKRTGALVTVRKRRKKYRKGPIVYSDSESSEDEISNLSSRDKQHLKSKTSEMICTTNTKLSEINKYQVTKPNNTLDDPSQQTEKRGDSCGNPLLIGTDCLNAELESSKQSKSCEVRTGRSSRNCSNDGFGLSRLSADRRSDNDNSDSGIIITAVKLSETALRLANNTQNGEETSSSNTSIPTKSSSSETKVSRDSTKELDAAQMEQSVRSSDKLRIPRSHFGLLRRKNYKFAPLIFPRDKTKIGYVERRGKTSCNLSHHGKEASPQNVKNERISVAVNLRNHNSSAKNASLVSSVQELPKLPKDLPKICSEAEANGPHPKPEWRKTISDQNCSNTDVADAGKLKKGTDQRPLGFFQIIRQKVGTDAFHLGEQQDANRKNSHQNLSNIEGSCQKQRAVKSTDKTLNSVTKTDSEIQSKTNKVTHRSSLNENGVSSCESTAQQRMALASMSELFFGEENIKIKPAPSKKPALNLITEKVSEDSDSKERTLLDDDSLWSSPNKSSKL